MSFESDIRAYRALGDAVARAGLAMSAMSNQLAVIANFNREVNRKLFCLAEITFTVPTESWPFGIAPGVYRIDVLPAGFRGWMRVTGTISRWPHDMITINGVEVDGLETP